MRGGRRFWAGIYKKWRLSSRITVLSIREDRPRLTCKNLVIKCLCKLGNLIILIKFEPSKTSVSKEQMSSAKYSAERSYMTNVYCLMTSTKYLVVWGSVTCEKPIKTMPIIALPAPC